MNGRTRWATGRHERAERSAEPDSVQQLKVEKMQEAAAIVINDLPEIISALVEKAKEGSYLHAKCAVELARISDIELPRDSKPEPWVEELLTALRSLPNPAEPAAAS